MSNLPEAVAPQRVADGTRSIALINTIGMTVLFGIEICFLALAFDWSLAGLLHLPPAVSVPLGVIPMAAAIVATVWIARKTWQFERDTIG